MLTRTLRLRCLPALCLLIAATFPARAADFSFIYSGHTYLVSETNRTWQASATNAASRGIAGAQGHLAIIESAAENQAIFSQLVANITPAQFNSTVASDGGPGSYVWIAANDITVEGTWVWDGDGSGPSPAIPFFQGTGASGASIGGRYQNFGHYPSLATQWEPDNANGGLQDAAGIGLANWPRGFAGEWNDVTPTDSLWSVMEFDAVPEPSSALVAFVGLGITALRRRRNTTQTRPSDVSGKGKDREEM
jgi:hypothetical protein